MRRADLRPAAAGALGGLAATVLLTALKTVTGIPLLVEAVSDRALPHVPVDQFLQLLGHFGGPITAKGSPIGLVSWARCQQRQHSASSSGARGADAGSLQRPVQQSGSSWRWRSGRCSARATSATRRLRPGRSTSPRSPPDADLRHRLRGLAGAERRRGEALRPGPPRAHAQPAAAAAAGRGGCAGGIARLAGPLAVRQGNLRVRRHPPEGPGDADHSQSPVLHRDEEPDRS